ncbi:Fc receptor-like protein 4 [Sylvia borin]
MAGDTGMAGKVALLLWGAQTTQPPWTPEVLWDQVTLTCQGMGTAGTTTWYKDGQRWVLKGPNNFRVTQSGTYTCDIPGRGLSPTMRVLNDRLVLQVPSRTLLEGDTVTLHCRVRQDMSVRRLHRSGRYHCGAWMASGLSLSIPVTVTVHELFTVPVLEGPPEPTEGSPLNLSCLSTPSPLRPPGPLLYRFYQDGQLVGGPQGSPQLLVPAMGVSHSGNYSCQVRSEGGVVQKSSARLCVTVHTPVANATISPAPLSHQVRTGDPVTLRCSVQVGSAPVTFTWLYNGQEVAQSPVLELGDVDVGHSGTYRCVATNQLGQDGHRVFWAPSPELALEVTPGSPWVTAVAVNVGRTLLFLVLLLAVIGGCHCWHRMAARRSQDRTPPDEGAVLDPHAVGTERAGETLNHSTSPNTLMPQNSEAGKEGDPLNSPKILNRTPNIPA